MPYALLPQRGLLRLCGKDTLSFLQGLVSNDVFKLKQAGILYAALLTPQGKFLHDFFLISDGEAVLLDSGKARLPDLQQRLNRYRLRSQVTIEALPETEMVAVVWGEMEPKGDERLRLWHDPRLAALGWRGIGKKDGMEEWRRGLDIPLADARDYDRMRLEFGVPEGGHDLMAEKSFILPFGFEALHGVDFGKGCYVGQEVTARGKHLGQIRKSVYILRSDGEALPEAGTPVQVGETQVGELRSAQGNVGLALLQVEAAEQALADGIWLRCGGVLAKASRPAWGRNLKNA